MWSATRPKEVQNLTQDYLHDFYHVTVGSLDLAANKDVTQAIEVCTNQGKYLNLNRYLHANLTPKDCVLVFVETKKGCGMLTRSLHVDGFQAQAMHSDKSQEQHDWAYVTSINVRIFFLLQLMLLGEVWVLAVRWG